MLIGTVITPRRRAMAVLLGFDGNIPETWPQPAVLDKLIECEDKCGWKVLKRVIVNLIYPDARVRKALKLEGLEGVSGEL